MAQCISAFEGAALAHQSNVHACAAQPTNGKIPWLWDTAAGRHLIGRQALDGEMKRCLQPSQNPVAFSTGGGPQPSQDSLGFRGSAILKDEEVYVLKECPPAQSIGVNCTFFPSHRTSSCIHHDWWRGTWSVFLPLTMASFTVVALICRNELCRRGSGVCGKGAQCMLVCML